MKALFLYGTLAGLVPVGAGARMDWRGHHGLLVRAPGADLRDAVDYLAQARGLAGEDAMIRDVAACAYGDAGGRAEALENTEIMRYFGTLSLAEVARRLPMIASRAASRARAEASHTPATLRADWGPDAVEVSARSQPYSGFFTLEETTLTFRRFDGTMSRPVTRAGFVGGDAAIVLPYDPERGLVMVIEQFRYGPWLRHDPRPWLLEPIAGRVDAGETPAACARREAQEEAGIGLDRLHHVADYYPSPGVDTEYFYTFIGLTRLDPSMQGIGGLAGETEDIRSHVIAFSRLQELVSSGEVNNGPLVLLSLWLAANLPRFQPGA